MARPNKLIQFYLTNVCNSRCKTCNIWKNTFIREDLDVNKVIEIIKQFPDADYVFGGGEFTLYRYKNELLRYCDENDINYTVLTNCVSKLLVEDLLRSHNIKNLTISCDGLKHDEIRGVKGNLENIEFIRAYKHDIPNLKISYTLSKYNENHIDEDMDYFKNVLGFDKIYFCIAQDMDLLKQDDDVAPSMESIKYFYESYQNMLYDKDVQLLEDIINGTMKKCDSTGNVHTIYTNGDIVVCQSIMSYYRIGNIYDSNLKDILCTFGCIKECKYNNTCKLVCQRRYDYEDRL